MKKQWLALCAAFTLMLGACSTSQTAPQANEPAKTENSQQQQAPQAELMISAAASLTDALNELKTGFEAENPGTTLTFNFGSSGKLATQIAQGAPSDVFLSASKKDMDGLDEKQLIVKDTRQDFTKNSLVLIAGKDSSIAITSFEELNNPDIKHIAVGEPESVPAGRYAKETLDTLKMWESLNGRMVFGSDVRQVLTFVESKNAEVGIVYSSDAAISKDVKVLATAKPEWHKPIVYPGAVISASKHTDAAKAFLAYLTSDKGKAILQKYGFQ
ncbi:MULTISPECIES: molybdate ABC transporter substrate-binding protein [Brevibacillus]|jgi:molybdate transport system substrate-binding protein|uniref:Molybdate ABC transporter substrate-binding protein n=1 Tax=Brevibacillus parabrevis TaxID=54914 RepID=A0A4Y3PDW0_BREPA|nr:MULTISPECIES: molybdate ABC transporter substrate-binding protein [Brevibacillus]EJL41350.1 molybdenum ABC transporter, periplasmic molybdate-binding protein [Brevibacillus sp. CF112]MBU8711980.1 molybdate ABC transporter substrate-binding protein [Brevibacillus parabrevis]MDH6349044.1 molybdate transport system substrate-binding protein [Brevibacillus sp. 1238]MDR5001059.1 molybdate ABC transporter substrate-binding protein [Brevibacillus parabrevis]MED2257681.1 molybdate ABC transporter s